MSKGPIKKPNEEQLQKVDAYFKQIVEFINKLPLNEKGKAYIRFNTFVDFYDTLVLGENGEYTDGIQTEWQLRQFKKRFQENLKKLKLIGVQKYSELLSELPPEEARAKVSNALYRIKQKEMLAEMGGEAPSKWDKFRENYLLNEKKRFKEAISYQKFKQSQKAESSKKIETPPQQGLAKKEEVPPPAYNLPVFNQEAIPEILRVIGIRFPTVQAKQLKLVLETGKILEEPLTCIMQANSLCDFFSQLYRGQFVGVHTKADFEEWISKNFRYIKDGEVKEITAKYASKFISGGERPPKGKRLIEIKEENGKNIIVVNKIEIRQKI